MTEQPASLSVKVPSRSAEALIDARTVLTLARKELRDALRNRWLLLYSIAFAVLATGLAYLSLAGSASYGFASYGRTAASLINLIILIVPLMALTAGAGAIAPERESGTLAYLLAQPVNRLEVLLGKFFGLGAALLAALSFGFGVSAALIATKQQINAADFAYLVGLSFILAIAMLNVGILISVLVRKASTAMGVVIVLWLALVLLGDLGLMGSTLIFKIQVAELFNLSLINPLQVFKMASLNSINASLDVLGPAGMYATRTYGEWLPWIFGGVLAAWATVPLMLAGVVFPMKGTS